MHTAKKLRDSLKEEPQIRTFRKVAAVYNNQGLASI